jgi:hypothetical protein
MVVKVEGRAIMAKEREHVLVSVEKFGFIAGGASRYRPGTRASDLHFFSAYLRTIVIKINFSL